MIAAISNLAMINTSFGIDVGNEVLAAVAGILDTEIKNDGTLTAFAPNKLGIILNNADADAMRRTAERLIEAVRKASHRQRPPASSPQRSPSAAS